MVTISDSIVINRPPGEVFAFAGNYENDPQWRAGVSEMRHDPPGQAQVGTKTYEVMRFMGRNAITFAEVVEYEIGSKAAFRTTSGAFSASGYRLVEAEGMGTRFTYHAEAKLSGLLALLAPLLVGSFRRRLRADLERLKGILDTVDELLIV